MDHRIIEILEPAYQPCRGFSEVCHEMRWHSAAGHIPRGFLGARGELSEVELILVFAEPGDPLSDEKHSGMQSALDAAEHYHGTARDQFHKNARHILNLCWPGLTFTEQLSKVWLTESVLCSAPVESGGVRKAVERTCGQRYLLKQLALFPDAVVVGLGLKAQNRMRALGFHRFLSASAVAPPEGNKPHARRSWVVIAEEVARRRGKPLTGIVTRNITNGAAIGDTSPAANSRMSARQAKSELLVGAYRVVDTGGLRANEKNDPAKWSLWKLIWESKSFEELKQRAPREVFTRTNRRITWQSETRWALKCSWIEKVDLS